MINRLVSLGNVIIDIVAEVPSLLERGGDTLASGVALEVGGGFNLGAFIAGLAAGRDAEAAAWRGNVVAALTVSRRGPATSPTAVETDRFIAI
jgi:sugar/nucleoside kinase (ribokinase family)